MSHRINPRTGNIITAAGIEIGVTWQAPPAPLGSNAERIQAALLSDRDLSHPSIFQHLLRLVARRVHQGASE
jgi:hypothetical protein